MTLCQASVGTGGTWNREGVILFTVLGVPQISRVSASGGPPEVVLRAGSRTNRFARAILPARWTPVSLPGHQRQEGYEWHLCGLSRWQTSATCSRARFQCRICRWRCERSPARLPAVWSRRWADGAGLRRRRVAHQRRSEAPIAARLGTVQGANISYRRRNFTASDNGLLIYDPHTDRQRSQLLWVDRNGKSLHVLAQLDNVSAPVLSPDESRIVVARKDLATNNNDLWLTDPLGDNPVRFTFDPGSDLLGLWSPDGQRIVWTSTRNGSFDLYEKEVSSTGKDTLLLRSELPKFPLDWSRDGHFLLFRQINPQTNHDIFVLPTTGERKPFPYLQTPAMENGGAFSPDGNWIAYNSDESGRVEVYVESFPTHGGKRQISLAGGSGPRWRADGKELYYYSLDGRLMAVSVTGGGASLTTGTPTVLFAFRPAAAYNRSILRRHAERRAFSAERDCRDRCQGAVVSRAELDRGNQAVARNRTVSDASFKPAAMASFDRGWRRSLSVRFARARFLIDAFPGSTFEFRRKQLVGSTVTLRMPVVICYRCDKCGESWTLGKPGMSSVPH